MHRISFPGGQITSALAEHRRAAGERTHSRHNRCGAAGPNPNKPNFPGLNVLPFVPNAPSLHQIDSATIAPMHIIQTDFRRCAQVHLKKIGERGGYFSTPNFSIVLILYTFFVLRIRDPS